MAFVDENSEFTEARLNAIAAISDTLTAELVLMKDLVVANPTYALQWKDHPQFRKIRSTSLALSTLAGSVLKRRLTEEEEE